MPRLQRLRSRPMYFYFTFHWTKIRHPISDNVNGCFFLLIFYYHYTTTAAAATTTTTTTTNNNNNKNPCITSPAFLKIHVQNPFPAIALIIRIFIHLGL